MTQIEFLEKATNKGIISDSQLERLKSLLEQENLSSGEEKSLNFLSSYSDFFIALGIVLTTISILVAGLSFDTLTKPIFISAIIFQLILAYWLVSKQRRKLCGIVINLSVAMFLITLLDFEFINISNDEDKVTFPFDNFYKALVLSASMLAFFILFRLPFSLGLFALTTFAVARSFTLGYDFLFQDWMIGVISCTIGAIFFILAIWQDSKDLTREKLSSDYAFWLHTISAPIILFGILNFFYHLFDNDYTKLSWFMLVAVILLTIVAIFIDRRSLLSSSILLLIILFSMSLGDTFALKASEIIYIVLGAIGLLVILVGGFWYRIRNLLFSRFQNSSMAKYVPAFVTP